ncbi:plastocyanin/azurin family copper-binding protein [Halobacteriales archaeon Cl-PHB]
MDRHGSDTTTGTDVGPRRLGRRRLLRTGLAAAAVGLAGCGSSGSGDGDAPAGGDGENSTPADGGGEATSTSTASDGGDGGGGSDGSDGDYPPGADVVGGPNDLQSSVSVDATVLDEDQGAGRYVFTPALVWLETGGTVYWNFKETKHTVTVYHPQYDKPQRIPNGVETPFSSEFTGGGEPGTSFNFVFETPGVWNYFCKPHEDKGMVGVIVVGSVQNEGGVVKPKNVESEAASEKLTTLLKGRVIG